MVDIQIRLCQLLNLRLSQNMPEEMIIYICQTIWIDSVSHARKHVYLADDTSAIGKDV